MYHYLLGNDKLVFINLEDPIQVEKSRLLKAYSFGNNKTNANVNITSIEAKPFVIIGYADLLIQSHLIGLYNANNINAALTIGKFFGVADIEIKNALESYIPENNRSQLVQKGTNRIVLDAYNANPSSMKVAIENFLQLDNPDKVMILGDMFELGDESLQEHNAIVVMLSHDDKVMCYFVGSAFYENKIDKHNFRFYDTFERFSNDFSKTILNNVTILIKGSRGMALERTLEFI